MSSRLEKLQAFLQENPTDAFLIFALAKEFEKTGDQSRAAAQYEKLVREIPDYVGTYYHFGKLLESMGQAEQAIQMYQAGMEIAKTQGDQHAFSELAGAKLGLTDD
ncbi:MAG: hypothetical protein KDC34_16800 [Saprospiraceae bacterium]|nr:hypothetical protein [Saprospiraceae bacterium]